MIRPPAIFGIGRNYAAHTSEMKGEASSDLVVFMKNPSALIASGSPIVLPNCCKDEEQVDYEGELAIQIATDCCNVSTEDASSYIAAYAVANDVTARNWQKTRSGGQWVRGKSFDTFCPISPWILASEVQEPNNLTITTTLNGEIVQQANTSEMIFSIPYIVSELSKDMTILAGTVILTGTPAGVGVARSPQRFLRDGDFIEVAIDGVGEVSNPVLSATEK